MMMASPPALVARWLAAPPQPPPGEGPEWGKAAPVGALVLVLLGIAVWVLMRSMNKHLRKIQQMAEAPAEPDATAAAASADRDEVFDGETPTDTRGVADADVDLTKPEPPTGG